MKCDEISGLFDVQLKFLRDGGATLLPLPLYNVIREIRKVMSEVEATASYEDLRRQLVQCVDEFCGSNFEGATNSIIDNTLERVDRLEATTILTCGWSPIIERVLLELTTQPRPGLHVKVVDGDPAERSGKRFFNNCV